MISHGNHYGVDHEERRGGWPDPEDRDRDE